MIALEEITPGNFDAATGIRVRPDQEHAVSGDAVTGRGAAGVIGPPHGRRTAGVIGQA